jgi:hypothetical protein
VLRARPCAGQRERQTQSQHAAGLPREEIAERRERCAKHQHDLSADPFGDAADRDLKSGLGAGIEPAHQGQEPIAQGELGLPDRQKHVDQVGVPIMEGVVEASHHQRTGRSIRARRWGR